MTVVREVHTHLIEASNGNHDFDFFDVFCVGTIGFRNMEKVEEQFMNNGIAYTVFRTKYMCLTSPCSSSAVS